MLVALILVLLGEAFCEFLALVTGVIVSSHVMACIMFFEHLVFSDVVILFVFFSLDVFFCMLLDVFVVL